MTNLKPDKSQEFVAWLRKSTQDEAALPEMGLTLATHSKIGYLL